MSLHNGRTSVFIDKFSVTFSVPNEGRTWQDAAEALSHLCQQGLFLVPAHGERVYEHYYGAWEAVIEMPNGKSSKCLIQAFPKSSKKGYLRLEWNPAKLPSVQFGQIRELLAACIPNIDEWWLTAKITRADITFDLPNIHINRLLIFSASAATMEDRKKHDGLVHSDVLGSKSSVKKLTLYDKAYEQTIRNQGGNSRGAKRIYRCRTRVEFRIRKIGSVIEMSTMRNPLSSFSIFSIGDAYSYSDSESWHRFIRRCESVGAQQALNALADRKRRQRYREIFNEFCKPPWFDSSLIWTEAKERIQALLLDN